jgi:4-hydroxy-3-polyprenylbenzoate decarboxylase
MHGLWGLGLLMLGKAIVVVDAWVDVQDLTQVGWQALGNVDWSRDIELTEGPVDHLDHASARHSFGGKISVDATAKLPEEGHPREWPEVARMSPEVQGKIDALWHTLNLG